jgi:glycosyltransferase involved in cell wall biosynthesis
MMGNIGLHIYLSNFQHESRIQKETKSLVESGLFDKIFIGALWEEGLKEHEQLDAQREVWRVRLKTATFPENTFCKIIKYIEWMFKLFFRFKKGKVNYVNCHNLAALPIGMLFKLFSGSKVVYDTHELETERCGWGKGRKICAKILERFLIYKTDLVVVVSESICQWYKEKYKLNNICTVLNIPRSIGIEPTEPRNILKEKFNLKDDDILFIYQGALGESRGIEILLKAFSKADRKKHIVFMGYGELEDTIKKHESLFSNIHFQSAVKPEEINTYARSADIGISLIENTCLSYFYSMPNKLFEYILSGLPVVVSNFPDMGRFVDENKCGWKVLPVEKSVTECIERITKDDIKEKRNNILKCKNNFGWQREEQKLLNAYRDLIGR